MAHPRFREDKATQAAALLLDLRGGRMNHLKLIKLLYLADRAALLAWGRPITYDSYVSMPHGPVLSFTLDRINDDVPPEGASYWQQFITDRQDNEVALRGPFPTDQLSDAEEAILRDVFEQYGSLNRWRVRDLSHDLPEWQDPKGSALPISYGDILKAGGLSAEDAHEIEAELEGLALVDRLLS